MPHIVEINKILPGNHRSQFQIYLKSDGVSGELVSEVLIDPIVDLGLKSSARMYIEMLTYTLVGFDAYISFDSGVPDKTLKWVLSKSSSDRIDFKEYGGLHDSSSVDGTGKLLITTTGLGSADSQGSILIMVRNS